MQRCFCVSSILDWLVNIVLPNKFASNSCLSECSHLRRCLDLIPLRMRAPVVCSRRDSSGAVPGACGGLKRLLPSNMGQKSWRCGGSNPRPFTCKANALPLSYIPCVPSVETMRSIKEVLIRRYLEHTNCAKQLKYPRGDSNPQSSV